MVSNSVHPTLTPSIIFQGYKLDITTQAPIPFGTFAARHYAKRVMNKYEPHTENGIVLYLADNVTSNVVAWIPGRNTVATINKYTIIKVSPSDFGLQDNTNIIVSHITYLISFLYLPVLKRVPRSKLVQIFKIKNYAAFPPLAKLEKNSGPRLLSPLLPMSTMMIL